MKFNLFVHSHGYTDRPVNLEILPIENREIWSKTGISQKFGRE